MFKVSIGSVLKEFHSSIDKLEKLHASLMSAADNKSNQADKLNLEAHCHQHDANHAKTVAEKIRALISS